jgi:hypothetical protein
MLNASGPFKLVNLVQQYGVQFSGGDRIFGRQFSDVVLKALDFGLVQSFRHLNAVL